MYKFLFLFLPFFSCAQELNSDSISIDFSSSFVERLPRKKAAYYLDNGTLFERSNDVLNSGKVIVEGDIKNLLEDALSKFNISEEYQIVGVQSNIAASFSTRNKVIFITTGLIAHLDNSAQLNFFIAREIARIQNDFSIIHNKKKISAVSYSNKINLLSQGSFEYELKLDSLAVIALKKYRVSNKGALTALYVLKYSGMPFDEIPVPTSYLETEAYYYPKNVFDLPNKKLSFTLTNQEKKEDKEYKKRVEQIKLLTGIEQISINKTSTQKFVKAKKEAHVLFTKEAIFDKNFRLAIYCSFLLESLYGQSNKFDKLKAHSWVGYTQKKLRDFEDKERNPRFILDSESGKFFFFLRRMNSDYAVSMALRIVYDLKDELPETENLRLTLVRSIKNAENFDLSEFKSTTFISVRDSLENLKKINDKLNVNKYTQLEYQHQNAKSDFDSSTFYLYGISDIVKSETFKHEYDSIWKYQTWTGKKIAIMPSVSIYKSRRCDFVKSDKKEQSLIKEIKENNEFDYLGSPSNLDYNTQRELKQMFSQSFQTNGYSKVIPILDKDLLSTISTDYDYLVLPMFQTAFRPTLRGRHFVGLFVAPLPFMISDFLLRPYQGISCMGIINAKTGELVKIEYLHFNDPLTGKTMYNRIFQFIYRQ